MAIRETVVSPPTRGAARTLDVSFPSGILQTLTNSSFSTSFLNRQTVVAATMGANSSNGGTSQWTYHNGRVCYRQSGTGANVNYFKSDSTFGISFPTLKSGVGGTYRDDYRCWRVMLTIAYDLGVVTSMDNGLEIGPMTDFNVVTANIDGIAYQPSGPTSFAVLMKQGHVITYNADVVTGVDITQFNTLEFRIIGATATNDAVVKAYFNNVLRQSWAYGAGSVLPNLVDGSGGGIGWNVHFGNRQSPATYIASAGLRIIAAATEDGLL